MIDHSSIGRSSRRRGHDFERDMAKYLSNLLKVKLHRTPASGGHAIKGDLYEPPESRTPLSNLELYCRTSKDISFESLLCDPNPLPIRWIEETGVDSVWFIRSRPGRVFVLCHVSRIRPGGIPLSYMIFGNKWLIVNVRCLNIIVLSCEKLQAQPVQKRSV